ncbi:MAG: hypothetical protein WCR30_02940 [Clostridia bacterium]
MNMISKFLKSKEKQETDALLVESVVKDFKKRQQERKQFEAQWQLNMNFLMGNQYCSISGNGEVEDYTKQYFWQEREVYNHIAPLMEVRNAKLSRVRPTMSVVPSSADEKDLKTAKLSKKILSSICNKINISEIISRATKWSEVCGTSFYKVVWSGSKGKTIATTDDASNVHSGDIDVVVCSPFEIFPDSTSCETLDDCDSLIHAKAISVRDIKSIWGKVVQGENINVFSLENVQTIGGLGYSNSCFKVASASKENYAVVIEKYEKPSVSNPNGRLTIVAGETLLYDGDLPFKNLTDGERGFPFIRQSCLDNASCFWGTSVIERMIPVQRAYNAVKNRKHEFLNRVSMGILTVEDGSVDIENLEDEGLSPGKVLVYRQGSNPPTIMSSARVPTDFMAEEQRLLEEFQLISGVSDLSRGSSSVSSQNMSGTALQVIVEQDDTRITITAESIRNAIKLVSQNILRLYKQFAIIPRLTKISNESGDVEVFYFSQSDISSDDIVFETKNEISETLAQRRTMVFDLLNAGLLYDENGKLSNRMRVKALDLLGFGIWENAQDINELNVKKASSENLKFLQNENDVEPLEIDDHKIHITEHTAFMLGSEFEKKSKNNKKLVENVLNHIRMHKRLALTEAQLDISTNKENT